MTILSEILQLALIGIASLMIAPIKFIAMWLVGTCDDYQYHERRKKIPRIKTVA